MPIWSDSSFDDDDDLFFMATFVYMVGYMGQTTSKGDGAKSKMNTLQICPRRDSNSGGSDMWSNALPTRRRKPPLIPHLKCLLHVWLIIRILLKKNYDICK